MDDSIKTIEGEITVYQEAWTLPFWSEITAFERMNSDFVTKATTMLETIQRDSKRLSDMLVELREAL